MKKYNILILCTIFFLLFHFSAKAEKTEAHFHIINFDSPIPYEEIKARYSCYDKVDGDITKQIKFISEYEKDYNNNSLKLKEYPLEISITNSRGHTTSRLDYILVRDFAAPKIEVKKKETTIDISTQEIMNELLNCFTINDNYDTDLKYDWIGIEKLEQGKGTYSISLIVYDSTGNASKPETITVHINKSITSHILKDPIFIRDAPKSKTEILDDFIKSSNLIIEYQSIDIESNYFSNVNKKGIYQANIVLVAKDGTQNIYQLKIINEFTQKDNTKTNLILFTTLGIILVIAIIGIAIYWKRR